MKRGVTLVDDRSTPPLREVIGDLLASAAHADIAVANVRLAALDLAPGEVASLEHCRLLMDRLDVEMLADAADDVAAASASLSPNLAAVREFVTSGRVSVRAAGGLRWSPDFSVFTGLKPGKRRSGSGACLLGAHYFSRPVVPAGASFTCILTTPAAISVASARFDELWENGHDILPVVIELLDELVQFSNGQQDEECVRERFA